MRHGEPFTESDFTPPKRGEDLRQVSYKLPVALLDGLAEVASQQSRSIVAVVRAALSRTVAAHKSAVTFPEEKPSMSNKFFAVERALRQGGRTPIELIDSTPGSPPGSSIVPWLALDRAFPVKSLPAEEGDPFAFYARGRADGIRELGIQRMEAGECMLPVTGLNGLSPVLSPEDLSRGRHSFAAQPLLTELGDRVICFAIQRVLTDVRCRGDVNRSTCDSGEVLSYLSTEASMLARHSTPIFGGKPAIILSPQRYRTLAGALSPRGRSDLDRLTDVPANVSAFHGVPEDTSIVLASELVVGLIPRMMVTRDGDIARLLLGVDTHLQLGSVVVAKPDQPGQAACVADGVPEVTGG